MKILPTNQTAQTPIILKDNTTQHTPIKENIEREGAHPWPKPIQNQNRMHTQNKTRGSDNAKNPIYK